MKPNLKIYFDQGITYEQYIVNEEVLLESPDDFEYRNYHELNLKRMTRNLKIAMKKDPITADLKDRLKNRKILIISEGWCGDASQIVPYAVWLAQEANIDLRIVYRDQNHELMNQFLTNGGMAIPVIIALNEDFEVLGHFAPRPAEAQELMLKMKSANEPKDEISLALQKWYNKDRGTQIIAEIIQMMNSTS